MLSRLRGGRLRHVAGRGRGAVTTGLRVARNIVAPDTSEVRAHCLVAQTPCPTLSPWAPGELASTVVHVPPAEIDEFLERVVSRYLRTIRRQSVFAALGPARYRALTDLAVGDTFARSLYARFLRPVSDDDVRAHADALPGLDATWLTVDFAHLENVEALPGFFITRTAAWFSPSGDGLRLEGIAITDLIVRPGDVDWERAKLFLVQSAVLSVLICEHPKQHFLLDAINGLTKVLLPSGHPVRRLLTPHLAMQLPLNFAVLYISKSVGHNDQAEVYTPFPNTKAGFIASIRAGYAGHRGHPHYPAYRYRLDPEPIWGSYGAFLADYWQVIHTFVTTFLHHEGGLDDDLRRWADECAHFVPGFPDGSELRHDGVLARALTTFIHTASVAHSCDHFDYATADVTAMPLRIRIPPPSSTHRGQPFDGGEVFSRTDVFRHHMAMEMYFRTHPLWRLVDVGYDTRSSGSVQAVATFHRELRGVQHRWGRRAFIPLGEIATSIQF